MASIQLAGTVTGGKDGNAVSVREFDGGLKIASFSVADREYFYSKDPDRKGQFYQVEVRGKAAEIAADRLSKGSRVAVSGQIIQRDYNGKTYLDVKEARVTYLDNRPDKTDEEAPF